MENADTAKEQPICHTRYGATFMETTASDIEFLTAHLGITAATLASIVNVTQETLLSAAARPSPATEARWRKATSRIAALRESLIVASTLGFGGRLFLNLMNEPLDDTGVSLIGKIIDSDASPQEVEAFVRVAAAHLNKS